jgi:hypothetical protein
MALDFRSVEIKASFMKMACIFVRDKNNISNLKHLCSVKYQVVGEVGGG